jgi:flagellar motor switch protein FliN/FliY
VDVLVNGRLVARGEVVVIEDNFGVRITEIVNPNERLMRSNEVA